MQTSLHFSPHTDHCPSSSLAPTLRKNNIVFQEPYKWKSDRNNGLLIDSQTETLCDKNTEEFHYYEPW